MAGAGLPSGGSTTRASLGLDTTDSPQLAGVNLGHASDTTLGRSAAGVAAVEGKNIWTDGGPKAIADLASAADITLPATGDYFRITGTTNIGTITAPASGTREITLIFTASLTLGHNSAGTGAPIILPSGANFSATDDDVVKLVYEATDGKWLAFVRQAL